ncbi:hypothetical protein HOD29_02195 [archaeon]|jgi:hypothetical protein|nr:hypothetical protein [archaeon]
MKYKSFEVKLKTNKTREYLWEKINTPKKLIKLEHFPKNSKFKKISENNYEFYFGKRFAFLTFVPNSGVNMSFIENNDSSLAWFEIKGEKNCTIIHGTSVRMDDDDGKWYRKNKKSMGKHFMEELKEWAKW